MTPPPRSRIVQRLGFQIAFLLAAGLLPLTLISMFTSLRAVDEMQARSEAALTGDTMLAASNQVRLIQEARGAAAAIASLIGPLLGDDAACNAALRDFVAEHPVYAVAAFIPRDGKMRCSSSGRVLDVSQNPIFQATVKAARPKFFVYRSGPISGLSVLGVSHPVFGPDGAYLGYVGFSLPHSKLEITPPDAAGTAPMALMTFDRDGKILAASIGLDNAEAALPQNHPLAGLTTDHPVAFSDWSRAGQRGVFSVVPLVPGELFALGTWPADTAFGPNAALVSIPLVLPALIWLASVVSAWLSVEWLVNRHIRQLNRSIKSFAGGNRMLTNVDVTGAPLEIREIGAAFEQMTDAVIRDEAELEDTLHQKEVLLREVHHRVKNNLQMIASIMNMHGRKARTAETQQVIRGLQGRVMSLATIHRELYQTKGLGDVHADELLSAIARQTVNIASSTDRRFDLRLHLEDIHMTPDQAVPLGLLAGEGLMNAAGYAPLGRSELSPLDLRLSRTAPDAAVLQIEGIAVQGEGVVPPEIDESMGFSLQLMTVFALQLGGKLDQVVADGTYRLRIDFQLRPLVEGEDRHVGPSDDDA